jgi:D-aspartate ligase
MSSRTDPLLLPAVVLSCQGAPEADLNLVRALGEQGVPVIVVAEEAQPPSRHSRYCVAFHHLPDFTRDPARLLVLLRGLQAEHQALLPVFPSADPDLAALLALELPLATVCRSVTALPDVARLLMDKRAFGVVAEQLGLPVPRTFSPRTMEAAAALSHTVDYPVIVKPTHPVAWKHPGLDPAVARAKALLVDDPAELMRLCGLLAPHGLEVLVQEYIPGLDEEHYSVHVYVDPEGCAQASYTARKWRTFPIHAGSGCHVESVHWPALESEAVEILQTLGFRGIANMNFKRHARTGRAMLIEINPRTSQTSILAARAGVNLAWLAYRATCALPRLPAAPRRFGLRYLNAGLDFHAFRAYRRVGEWGWGGYLPTVLRPGLVYQYASLRDPKPLWHLVRSLLVRRFGAPAAASVPRSGTMPDGSHQAGPVADLPSIIDRPG